jgi:hypothetical protein
MKRGSLLFIFSIVLFMLIGFIGLVDAGFGVRKSSQIFYTPVEKVSIEWYVPGEWSIPAGELKLIGPIKNNIIETTDPIRDTYIFDGVTREGALTLIYDRGIDKLGGEYALTVKDNQSGSELTVYTELFFNFYNNTNYSNGGGSGGGNSESTNSTNPAVLNMCFSATDSRSKAVVLHRKHVYCNDSKLYEVAMKGLQEQYIVINSEKRQYCNFECKNRKQEQCYNDGSFDTYYQEWCENFLGERINISGADIWGDYGYDCYSDSDCSYEKVCKSGNCVAGDVGDVQCTHDYDCPSSNVCSNYKCVEQNVEGKCVDSDGGDNIYVKGEVKQGGVLLGADCCAINGKCSDTGTQLWEFECSDDTGLAVGHLVECKDGCVNGSCLQGESLKDCYDSDGGINYYLAGYVDANGDKFNDYCMQKSNFVANVIEGGLPEDGDSAEVYVKGVLVEYYCYVNDKGENKALTQNYICPTGCSNGACVGLNNENKGVVICESGCVIDGKCYVFGYRKSNKYCSDKNLFVDQLRSDLKCDNNFECTSNVCVSGKCVSEGLISRILNWFKNIF